MLLLASQKSLYCMELAVIVVSSESPFPADVRMRLRVTWRQFVAAPKDTQDLLWT
jgi:hypothetical protein